MSKSVSIWVVQQSLLEAVLLSAFKFIMLGGLFWFNYNYINGSYFVNFIILIIFLAMSYNLTFKNEKKFNSFDDAIDYLLKQEKEAV